MAAHADRIDVRLPHLTPFGGPALAIGEDYDGIEFRSLDLSGQIGSNSRFLDCGIFSCQFDAAVLRRVKMGDCVWADAQATSLDVGESSWRDVIVKDCRIGALSAAACELTRVRITGGKYDYVNLRAATISDVVFTGCRFGEVDLALARIRDVSFRDCEIERLDVSAAKLHGLDLSRSQLHRIEGIGSLAGAVISDTQLVDLAPALAEQLGIQIVVPEA